ncbi:DUF4870 domain-containing protein [Halobacteria archaeon AArc-dxtr1]|nr:DUF4870 domain-containing protein [Halobacteria archaeon AArc-dxtr1]
MATDSDTTHATASTTEPGPDLLTERTLSGIFVHLLGLATAFVLPAVVYLAASRDFTQKNARNALNWQACYFGAMVALLSTFGVAVLLDSLLPETTVTSLLLIAVLLAFVAGVALFSVALFLNLAFALVATGKAIFGSAWEYPIAPDLVGRLEASRIGWPTWRTYIAAYALGTPVVLGSVLATGVYGIFDTGWNVFLLAVLLTVLVTASCFVPVAVFRDASELAHRGAAQRPNWRLYVAVPIGVAVAAFFVADRYVGSVNPGGDAVYAFLVALWAVAVVYLDRRRRLVGAS